MAAIANSRRPSVGVRHGREDEAGGRFAFGKNWMRFLRRLDEAAIASAERSLVERLGAGALAGRRFIDIGCGSGLFSLAARRLGARVTSFDDDPQSVACAEYLRQRFWTGDSDWSVLHGSVLDRAFLTRLGKFDVIYAWGVVHHTGAMWTAIDNVMSLSRPGGTVLLAVYNDQGWLSCYWRAIKRLYNRRPWLRGPLIALYAPYYGGIRWLVRWLGGQRVHERGMSLWHDLIDWLGGYPFEVATPGEVIDFAGPRGFRLTGSTTVGRRQGCNEFVFVRDERGTGGKGG